MEDLFEFRIDTADSGKEFAFRLHKKSAQLSGVKLSQWWMPLPRLYKSAAQNKSAAPDPNFQTILDLFWEAVRENKFDQDRQQQEKYLLAFLAPQIRSNGSRRVFQDAFLLSNLPELESEIQGQLKEQLYSPVSPSDFGKFSWVVLGRSPLSAPLRALKDEMTAELLTSPCEKLARGAITAAQEDVLNRWTTWKNHIGRRGKKKTSKKQAEGQPEQPDARDVLDILSYESRAAFHLAYSNAWCCLIDCAKQRGKMGEYGQRFHQWWHTSPYHEVDHVPYFSGHVFALHPGCGLFLKTSAGRSLLGNRLRNPTDQRLEHKFYGGMLRALQIYSDRRDEVNSCRRQPACQLTDWKLAEQTQRDDV